ncbi:MAG: alcohol dehydrogenase catalytic domain-containing protein [Myxococcota bacterium]
MQQLQFLGPRQYAWRDVPEPKLDSNEAALLRPLAVARCDLDLYIGLGQIPRRAPFAVGHEMVAEVLDVGDAVTTCRPGDRVCVSFQIHCGRCGPCQAGRPNACDAVPFGANYGLGRCGGIDFGGAFSDVLRVPFANAMIVRLPADVDVAAAAHLADNAADGYRTVAPHLRDEPGAAVLVVGGLAQSVGLFAAQAALGLGAERVVYADADPGRLALAERLGVEPREVSLAAMPNAEAVFPIVVDACTLEPGRRFAIDSTAPGGICTSVSNGTEAMAELPLLEMYKRGVRYEISRVQSRPMLEEMLGHVCAGRWDPGALVTKRACFEDAAELLTDPAPKLLFSRASVLPETPAQELAR